MIGESARAYADTVRASPSSFAWSDLEASQFAAVPDIQRRVIIEHGRLERRASVGGLGIGLLYLIVSIAPLLVPGILVVGGRLDAPLTPFLVAATALALAYVLVRGRETIRAARGGGPTEPPRLVLLSAFGVVFGLIAAVLASVYANVSREPWAWPTLIAVIAMTGTSAASIVVARLRSAGGSTARADATANPSTGIDALRAEIDALDSHVKGALAADLSDALDRLARHGIVSAEARRDAAHVPLGGLARWAWARDRAHGSANGTR